MTMALSRETIKLMLQSQRIIKQEFGVRIDLDDDQAIARFFAYASQSSSDDLKNCTNQLLAQLVPESEPSLNNESVSKAASVRYYRGQPVTAPVGQSLDRVDESEKKTSKHIIYRGQKISC